MQPPLSNFDALEMATVAVKIAEQRSDPKEFFERWPDISKKERKDITELWFQMSYYENDRVHSPDSAEWYRLSALDYAARIRERITAS